MGETSMEFATGNASQIIDQLTAIRSAAEILREVEELDVTERRRFTGIVLTAGKRLETLLLASRS